ncbi:MAG: hypothetical protein KAS21_00605 [Candidatus Aminicenantes bacterium]|nr:hypothetical protein [Candidatus Aminicenantes bacterium]
MNKKIKDEDIKVILNSMDFDIPSEIDAKVNEMIYSENLPAGFFKKLLRTSNPFIKWVPAFASILLLITLGLIQLNRNAPERKPLSEIKIEYELKDKNIKIIWVKKENFLLRRLKK